MGLAQQRGEFQGQFLRTATAGRTALHEAEIEEVRTNFALEAAAEVGTIAARFRLPDA